MGSTSVSAESVKTGEVQTSPSGQNTFEAFVKSAIQKIQREAWGRSSEVVEIRNACQTYLGKRHPLIAPSEPLSYHIDQLSSEEGGAALGVPFDEQRTRAVRREAVKKLLLQAVP